MAKKYYAVKSGSKKIILETNEEFLEAMKDKKAEGKGFKTLEEAQSYLDIKKKQKAKKYYAVKSGSKKSIFETNEAFLKAMKDKKAEGRGFKTLEDAESYLNITSNKKAKKYYAVKVGNKIGIFETCREFSKAMKYKRAEGRKFKTLEEAESYINLTRKVENNKSESNNKIKTKSENMVKCTSKQNNIEINEKNTVEAYVDGSFTRGMGGYGIIFKKGDNIILKDFSMLDYISNCTSIIAELMGARRAVELAIANGYKRIIIVHDYVGISMVSKKNISCENQHTKSYKKFIEEASNLIDIKFVKIESKHGDNKIVDMLAKKAIENFYKGN